MMKTLSSWKYFQTERWRFALSILLASLTYISTVSLLAASGWLIAKSAQMPPVMELSIAVVAVRTFALLRSTTRYAERLVSHDATFRSLTRLRIELYEKLEELTPRYISQFRRGDLLSRVVTDVDEIQNIPLRVVIPIASSVIATLFSIALMTWLLPLAGFFFTFTLLIAATFVPWLTTRNLLHLESQVAQQRGQLNDEIIEHFAGLTDVIMLGSEKSSLDSIQSASRALMSVEKSSAIRMGLANSLLVLLQGLALITSVACAVNATQSGQLSAVTMVVVSLLPLAAFESVLGLPMAITAKARAHGSARRIQEILEMQVAELEAQSTNTFTTDIDVNRVQLAWPETNQTVISDLSFTAMPGNRIGIVGPSGSGKSTIVSMLIKFLSPTSGRYEFGGIDSHNISGETLRSYITATGHDAHLFSTSIRENLMLAADSPVDEKRLWSVLASLKLDSWVRSLPQGLDTVVGENGASISGGQRQRLLLARMLVRRPNVWVLDEPTEHLDSELAAVVMSEIQKESEKATLIVVSHRPQDIRESDTTITLS
jgi:ATP-binding cassette subfamily C protein CydCD